VVSRDKDLLDLMDDPDFRQRFPHLTILDPPAFLHSGSHTFLWDSTGVTNGSYTLQARAYDVRVDDTPGANEGLSSNVSVTVDNANNIGASSWSARLAAVSLAASGIQTQLTVQTRCSFQPYIQPCQPDLVQWASVSMLECGTRPASRSFLCHTPPLARRVWLSIATARPSRSQGRIKATRWRPRHPICAGNCWGIWANRNDTIGGSSYPVVVDFGPTSPSTAAIEDVRLYVDGND